MTFKIGKRFVGKNHPPLIIAELGINHNGSLKKAKKLVNIAARNGAEIIKHQTHIPEDEMSEEAKKIIPSHTNKNIFDIIKKCALSEKDEYKLMQYTKKKGLIFISTPFSRQAVDRLDRFKIPAFKIGSGECNNYPLVEYIAKKKKTNHFKYRHEHNQIDKTSSQYYKKIQNTICIVALYKYLSNSIKFNST